MQDCIRMTLVVSRGRTKEIQIVRTKEHSTNDKRKKNKLTFILCDEMKCLWGLDYRLVQLCAREEMAIMAMQE